MDGEILFLCWQVKWYLQNVWYSVDNLLEESTQIKHQIDITYALYLQGLL